MIRWHLEHHPLILCFFWAESHSKSTTCANPSAVPTVSGTFHGGNLCVSKRRFSTREQRENISGICPELFPNVQMRTPHPPHTPPQLMTEKKLFAQTSDEGEMVILRVVLWGRIFLLDQEFPWRQRWEDKRERANYSWFTTGAKQDKRARFHSKTFLMAIKEVKTTEREGVRGRERGREREKEP